MSIDMALQKWAIFIMGVYGEISLFLTNSTEISYLVLWKRWHTSWNFQLEIRSNKKVIAQKPLTNLYEMENKLTLRSNIMAASDVECSFVTYVYSRCLIDSAGDLPPETPGVTETIWLCAKLGILVTWPIWWEINLRFWEIMAPSRTRPPGKNLILLYIMSG